MKMKHIKETEPAPVSGQQLYAVLYDGDTATGTPQTWQIWTQEQMEHPDSRVLEHYPIVNSQQYRACNCHDELVKACQALLDHIDSGRSEIRWTSKDTLCPGEVGNLDALRAALNKATR